MARPRKEINREEFRKLCVLQCTEEEIAGWFECSVDTIERWCKREYHETFAEIYKRYSADGKTSLRRYQFALAKTNATMAIWLGKQWLGQRDDFTQATDAVDNKRHITVEFVESAKDEH